MLVTKIRCYDHQQTHILARYASRGCNITATAREPSHLAKTIVVLSCGEAERLKVKGPRVGRIERPKNWAGQETGNERQKNWKRTQREEGREKGGIYGRREKQRGNRVRNFPD